MKRWLKRISCFRRFRLWEIQMERRKRNLDDAEAAFWEAYIGEPDPRLAREMLEDFLKLGL